MAVDEYCTLPPFTRQTLFCLSTQVNPFTTKCKHLNKKKSIICCQFKDKAKRASGFRFGDVLRLLCVVRAHSGSGLCGPQVSPSGGGHVRGAAGPQVVALVQRRGGAGGGLVLR